ncbi:hypothetical protein AG1IA_07076 [Rhizoctonia solani AG-1 IA]|uniref:Uncharacterized protein n=1 Tax=Thanatephorus cucumeris (strain AG1-IA) TaxID=983506 RepID=L8WRA4_THACA|nr:hypothetical protein AG1IA_07076 [Rhizoctonia solani AG-1 IA]
MTLRHCWNTMAVGAQVTDQVKEDQLLQLWETIFTRSKVQELILKGLTPELMACAQGFRSIKKGQDLFDAKFTYQPDPYSGCPPSFETQSKTSKNINWIPKAHWVVDGSTWTSLGVTAPMDTANAFIKHFVVCSGKIGWKKQYKEGATGVALAMLVGKTGAPRHKGGLQVGWLSILAMNRCG